MKRTWSCRRVLLAALPPLAALGLLLGNATPVFAHGERAQDAFARMQTVGWWGVNFSKTTVQQGDTVTITGTAKILETWPNNLSNGNPDVCYLTVVEPGAQFVLKDRVINGVETPQSFFCHKGGIYNFKLTLAGRSPGTWHVHPGLAVRESGTIIGPGQWIRVTPSPAGFANLITLLNGQTIDLESYGQWFVVGFSILTFILGLAWMIKWTWSKPTVTRLAVSNQLPLNQDGGEAVGLITRRDHVQSAVIAGLTALLLVLGLVYQQVAYRNTLPPQSDWIQVPSVAQPQQLASVQAVNATWDGVSHVMTLSVRVHNTSGTPVQVASFRPAYLTFWNPAVGVPKIGPYDYEMRLSTDGTVAPGHTETINLTLPGTVLETEKLVPVGKADMAIGGLIEVRGASGVRNFDTVSTALNIIRL
jgi:methane/ammonia monooxygenase subunit B